MKIIGIIQARQGSSRLKNKVLLEILGKPMLWHIHNRLSKCELLDEVVISTGEQEKNLEIQKFAVENNIPIYVGKEVDLIDRLYQTALFYDASAIIRITGDCPLVDPSMVDKIISNYLNENEKYDIITNCQYRTFPHGLDIELFSFEILKKMWQEIKEPELREWFPFYITKNPESFRILNIENENDLSKFRWTVDYEEDYEFIKKIYQNLYKINKVFGMNDILELLNKNKELNEINSKYVGFHNIDSPKI
jgi:spore coat polysaccharide biosynthesis protein SpsF